MKLTKFVFITGLLLSLVACDNNTMKEARENGGGKGPDKPVTKPTPGKIVEDFATLKFQRPTQDVNEFLNVMNLPVSEGDRAYFSFSYAPGEDGTFYFTLDQVRLYPKDCSNPVDRSYKMEVHWQRIQGNERVKVKQFNPNIDDFDFQRGNKYILTYALMDLKEFADCKSVTLKFASFLKNYKSRR